MKRVDNIRNALTNIPGCIDDKQHFEWHERGDTDSIWQPEANTSLLDFDPTDRGDIEPLQPIFEVPPEYEADSSLPLLNDAAADEIKSRTRVHGIEALAWYVPFHQSGYQWGCYLTASGLYQIADLFLPAKLSVNERLDFAFHSLLRHELFHFATEYMASQWELCMRQPCYLPAKTFLNDPALGYILDEEKAANALMLRNIATRSRIKRVAGVLHLLREFTVEHMPPGYSDAHRFLKRAAFDNLLEDLAEQYSQSMRPPLARPRNALDHLAHYPGRGSVDPRSTPIFLVHDDAVLHLPPLTMRFIPHVTGILESITFVKTLARHDEAVKRAWSLTKLKLEKSTLLASLNFKPWPTLGKDYFSVRVTRSVRAHLKLHRSNGAWEAVEIGHHTAVGHG